MESSRAVLVTGGTGKTGRTLVRLLAEAGVPVRVASRNPGAVWDGVEPVRFDWEQPETHDAALAGVDRLYLVAPALAADPSGQVTPFLQKVVGAGVRRIVQLSAMGADASEETGHRKVERVVMASGAEYTILRPNWFMQNFSETFFLPQIRERAGILAPAGDAAVSFIDTRDIAAVAATALTGDSRHAGAEYMLTGGRALTFADVAATIGEAVGRQIRYVEVSPEQLRGDLIESGITEDYADPLVGLFEVVRADWSASTTNTVESVLGRPPIDFAAFARENAHIWHPAKPRGA